MNQFTSVRWEIINCNTSDLAEDWRVGSEKAGCSSVIPISDGKKIIAFAVHHSYGYAKQLPELEAIANLIAAAPDLLEACTAIVSWCDKNPPSGDALYCVHQARAAIAKATGESE